MEDSKPHGRCSKVVAAKQEKATACGLDWRFMVVIGRTKKMGAHLFGPSESQSLYRFKRHTTAWATDEIVVIVVVVVPAIIISAM